MSAYRPLVADWLNWRQADERVLTLTKLTLTGQLAELPQRLLQALAVAASKGVGLHQRPGGSSEDVMETSQ